MRGGLLKLTVTEIRPFQVVSAIPGRIRIQIVREFRSSKCLQEIVSRAGGLSGVTEATSIPDAYSVLIRYSTGDYTLQNILRALETLTVLTRRPVERVLDSRQNSEVGKGNNGSNSKLSVRSDIAVGNINNGNMDHDKSSKADFQIAIKHFIPGRMRLQVSRMRWTVGLAIEFEQLAALEPGIMSVETKVDGGFVIVRYDAKVYKSTSLLARIRHVLTLAIQAVGSTSVNSPRSMVAPEQIRSTELTKEEAPALNPLVFPTAAMIIAGFGGALPIALVGGALAIASIPTGLGALQGLREKRFNVAQLDFAALIALGVLGQFFTGGVMTWLIGLGELIRTKTMRQSRRAISELMSPAGQSAWVERDGAIISLSLDRLEEGDVVCVYPGDQVPVDGVVVEGKGLVDQKLLTGESVPVSKEIGDAVFALTMVSDGQMKIRVEHIGTETRAGRVVEMIESAPLSDTRVSNYAALVGDRLVPGIFALAGVVFLLTADLARTASILILDFVTGIRVSAPTTILSAMTGAAKQGIFIKGGKAMETLAEVDAIVFDKTGTLTHGSPFVTGVLPTENAFDADDVLRLAASAEANLKHPAAKAIVDAALARGLDVVPPIEMEYVMGQGVYAVVDGRPLHVGSRRFMDHLGVDISGVEEHIENSAAAANSLVFCATEGRLIGLISYSDPPRPESESVIRALRDRGVKRIVMLTGDNQRAAESVATRLGITDIIAEAFPEQKAEVVERLREEGYIVAVIGDGINDSPAFTRANVGISLQHGADVAKETADVILLDGDLRGLPLAIDLSREAIKILNQNVNVIIAPTAIGMAAAAIGLSNPLISTIINNGTTVVTGLNALRPMFPKASRKANFLPLPETVQGNSLRDLIVEEATQPPILETVEDAPQPPILGEMDSLGKGTREMQESLA